MMDEELWCWDDYPYEHGCICGNECPPPMWMLERWKKEEEEHDIAAGFHV